MKTSELIDRLQSDGESAECAGDEKTFRLLDTCAQRMRDMIRLLEVSLEHIPRDVLGPDSRCTPDWFVEAAAIVCDADGKD